MELLGYEGKVRLPTGREIVPAPGWKGGVSVACDGERVVTGLGIGAGAVVHVWSVRGDRLAGPVNVFPDDPPHPPFRGGVNVWLAGGEVRVSPKEGGGPVVVRLRHDLTEIGRGFVGDPKGRAGVHGCAVPAAVEPPVTVGGGPLIAYLDGANAETVRRCAEIWDQCPGLLTVTNRRPSRWPSEILTVYVGPVPYLPGGTAGQSVGTLRDVWRGPGLQVYAVCGDSGGVGSIAGTTAAHELGHMKGLIHTADPRNLMNVGDRLTDDQKRQAWAAWEECRLRNGW